MLTVVVYDTPRTQGSKVAFISRSTGRAGMKEQLGDDLKTWREAVKSAALDAMARFPGAYPLTGPLVASVTYTLYKPQSAPKRKPSWPMGKKNDLDKLLRSTFDSLTAAGVWGDDGQVVELTRLAKYYTVSQPGMPLPLAGPAHMFAIAGTRSDLLSTPGAVIRVASIEELPGMREGWL